jgi:hypothetical protein
LKIARTLAFLLLAGTLSAAEKDLKADFGAVGDFVADDTAAVQAAFDWVIADKGELFIPEGVYRITSQLTFRQGTNTLVRGRTRPGASWATALKWDGPAGGTFLLLDGSRDTEWSDFAIDAGVIASIEPDILVDIDKVTAGPLNSRENAFRRMMLRGGKVATVRISHTTNANNEANIFEDVGNYSVPGSVWSPTLGGGPVGYLVQNVNAKGQQILRGDINGKAVAVHTEDGSVHITGAQIGGCGTWLKHGGRGEPSVMSYCDGDSSRTFIEISTAQTGPVTAIGNRFYQLYDGPLLILNDNIGPLALQGNEFANGGYKTPAQSFTQIAGNGPVVIATGNTFANDQMLPVPGLTFPKLRSLYAFGNMFYGPGNTRNLLNDYLVPNRQSGQSVASLQIGGSSGFRAEVQSFNSAALSVNSNQSSVPVTTTGNLTLTTIPSIRPGMFEGQELRIVNVGANTFGLFDEKTLPGTGLMLLERTIVLAPKASVQLQWTASYGGRWIQVSPVVSPL